MTAADDHKAEARQLVANATRGQWVASRGSDAYHVTAAFIGTVAICDDADTAALIAAAPRLLAALADDLDTAQARIQQLEQTEPVGVDYCTVHHGIRNEDDHRCDFADDDLVAVRGDDGQFSYPNAGPDGEPRDCVLVPLVPRPLASDTGGPS